MKRIYLDNAAATPINLKVRRAMFDAMAMAGNPSSYNNDGRQAAQALAKARLSVARFLGARPGEIIFTSSGSEANALAIAGIFRSYQSSRRKRLLASAIEHPSVIQTLKLLTKDGAKVKELTVDKEGLINPADLKNLILADTLLVSVMYANNEIGTIEPIREIGKIIQEHRLRHQTEFPLLHVDACQAVEYLDMNVHNLGADLVTFNGSKIYGPRGIGALYVRRGIKIVPLVPGTQELGRRGGTENLPAIIGLAEALRHINRPAGLETARLRDYFIEKLIECVPDAVIHGAGGDNRLPNNISFSVPGIESENTLLELDKFGVNAGSGSACAARSIEPSHVLKAIGVKAPYLGAIRFSLGRQTTKKDLDYVLKVLPAIVKRLRKRYA